MNGQVRLFAVLLVLFLLLGTESASASIVPWQHQEHLFSSNGIDSGHFGSAIAISGETVVVGAPGEQAATIFVRSGTTWTEQQRLDGSSFAGFGNAVAISGETVVVGAAAGDSAIVYVRHGTIWTEQQQLAGSDSAPRDDFGKSVAISGETIVVGAQFHNGEGAAYVFARNGSTWSEQDKLVASNGTAGHRFGWSVAVSGETAVVGAPDNIWQSWARGEAYVFVRSGADWTEQARLTASDGVNGDVFGWSVAASGETIVVGAPYTNGGAAYVFAREGMAWNEQQKLMAANPQVEDLFGDAVAIEGETVVVGKPQAGFLLTGPGAAHVFTRVGKTWSEQQILTAYDGQLNDAFGHAVALTEDTVVVGAFWDDVGSALDQGSAYVFVLPGTTWTEQSHVVDSMGTQGDLLGRSVAISGETMVVGVPCDAAGGRCRGSVFVFVRYGTTWTEQQRLIATDGQDEDQFGAAVAISGETLVVGAPNHDDGADSDVGAVYVFKRESLFWSQQAKLTAADGAAGDLFGHALAISGETVVVGAPSHDDQGAVYVFMREGSMWSQQKQLTDQNGAAKDYFGWSVAISGETVVVGAHLDDVYYNRDQGSAHVFVRSGTLWKAQQQLTAADGDANDRFGTAVAISGETAIVGAEMGRVGANGEQGSAYMFVRAGTLWSQQQKLTAGDGAAGDHFGHAVSISGESAVVGSVADDMGANSDQGSAYVFLRAGTVWSQQQKVIASLGAANDQFGYAVTLNGRTAAVGAPYDDVMENIDQGSARVFVLAAEEEPPPLPK